jgi:hypothetical protein
MKHEPTTGSGAMTTEKLAKGLGWFSLGLGATQVLAPRWLGYQTGTGNHKHLMRALGVREIASGAAILTQDDPTPALWSRVAGDAMDLSLLGLAARKSPHQGRIAFAVAMVAGVTLLDVFAAQRMQRESSWSWS